jgi:hypothetical protein
VKLRSFDMPVPEGTMPAARASAAPERTESSGDGAPIDRIKAKIAELNALSAQIASEQGGDAVGDEPAVRSTKTGPEPMTLTALREAEAELAAPLEPEALPEKTLDEVGDVVLPPPLPEPAPPPPPERQLTLAEKFKALREGMNG